MSLRRLSVIIGGAVALVFMPSTPSALIAQDCVGQAPKGGRWVTSAELYISRARRQSKPEDARNLWQQAVDVLEEGFQRQPDNPKNYAMAGQAYAELNQFDEADAAFTKAVDMWSCYTATVDTFRYQAWTRAWNLGVRYSQNEDEETAIEYYNNAWKLYDELPQPMLQLGIIYTNRALTAETEEERGHYEALGVYAYQNALNSVGDAPRISEAQRQEFSSAAAFNLAQILAMRERFEDAAEAYDMYLERCHVECGGRAGSRC
jgi:tetratricopeptide (TPR) repeat protein